MALASILRDLRKKSGLSLQQVADRTGASKGHLSGLERGQSTNPTLDVLKSLADLYGVPMASLLGEEAVPAPAPTSSAQVDAWVDAIRKEQAAGLNADTAAREARAAFERLMGPLDPQQEANWTAAREQISAVFERKIEFLGNTSLRRPRRPDWYAGPKATDRHWPKLQSYLLARKKWPKETVASIDRTSTEVVSLMENPAQSTFSGRGLVVGYVQSGKTANMEAVIAKAVDAGYRFVIILAGMTNSLRRQTQDRIMLDLVERDKFGWHPHTTSESDFRRPASPWFSTMDAVQIATVKKNVTPLKALLKTIENTPPTHRARMPVLLIDDECDQAGVNASGNQFNMTAINGLIRKILHQLPKVQYVGYTATPFANVLINPEKPAGGLDDLYPEDFITALPKPDGYYGAESLFGRDPVNADKETAEEEGLDMVRDVPDEDVTAVRPANSRERLTFVPSIPPSLEDALRYYVLATACRHARGQEDKHSSMLVHTTVYTRPHHSIAAEITKWKTEFAARLDTGDEQLIDELKALWEDECGRVPADRFDHAPSTFKSLRKHLKPVIDQVEIAVENSNSDSRLDFHSKTRKYIVVGGSVLARGLTIEGLVVSYFVRTSSQYDTLLQMGRWFGYREGYEDLPRIWMTEDLQDAFRDLATVEAEIRGDIEEYSKRDVTPADFAVRIRQIPGMAVTAAKKMIAAEACDISFSGEHLQTIRFPHRDGRKLGENWKAGSRLVDAALRKSAVETPEGGRLIRNVPLDVVLKFLAEYSSDQRDLISGSLVEYIKAEANRADAPYASWNLGIIEPERGKMSGDELGGLGNVRMVNRARLRDLTRDGLADIKALMSRQDVLIDVDGAPAEMKWAEAKAYRQSQIGDKAPLLLLYAIDAKSEPRSTKLRVRLDAARDMLGIGLVLPERGARTSYVRVTLPSLDAEDEDLAAETADEAEEAIA